MLWVFKGCGYAIRPMCLRGATKRTNIDLQNIAHLALNNDHTLTVLCVIVCSRGATCLLLNCCLNELTLYANPTTF